MNKVQVVSYEREALEDFKNNMANDLFGMTKEEAQAQELCISCKKHAMSHCFSDVDVREYQISGLCGRCFSQITGGGE